MLNHPRWSICCVVAALLFVLAYSYFFTERLPWFWYDDVQRLEMAEQSTVVGLVGQVFSFTSEQFGTERPVLQLFVKFATALTGGEDPHRHRLVKLALFGLALVVLYTVQVKFGVRPVAAAGIGLAATFPSVMIVSAWVNESAALEFLFLTGAFALFLHLLAQEEQKLSPRVLALAVLLVVLVIFADRAKATAKIIPMVFLSFLVLSRSRNWFLYLTSGLALLAVIPYGSLMAGGVGQGGVERFHWQLLVAFNDQAGLLVLCAVAVALLARRPGILRNRYLLFLGLWTAWEMLFFVFYPSAEIRYLYTALIAATTLSAAVVSLSLDGLSNKVVRVAAIAACGLTAGAVLVMNTAWNDSFRGTYGGYFVLIDKKIRFINEQYSHALALYADFTLPYYARHTDNRYANLNPVNAWKMRYDDVYRRDADGIALINPEQYSAIIALDESLPSAARSPLRVFDSVIEGSLWDGLHRRLGIKIRSAGLYDTALRVPASYPQQSGIYVLR